MATKAICFDLPLVKDDIKICLCFWNRLALGFFTAGEGIVTKLDRKEREQIGRIRWTIQSSYCRWYKGGVDRILGQWCKVQE